MIDSLAIIIAATMAFQPARPNLDREVKISAPAAARIEIKLPESVKPSEDLTTCYESKAGSCWSEG